MHVKTKAAPLIRWDTLCEVKKIAQSFYDKTCFPLCYQGGQPLVESNKAKVQGSQ